MGPAIRSQRERGWGLFRQYLHRQESVLKARDAWLPGRRGARRRPPRATWRCLPAKCVRAYPGRFHGDAAKKIEATSFSSLRDLVHPQVCDIGGGNGFLGG